MKKKLLVVALFLSVTFVACKNDSVDLYAPTKSTAKLAVSENIQIEDKNANETSADEVNSVKVNEKVKRDTINIVKSEEEKVEETSVELVKIKEINEQLATNQNVEVIDSRENVARETVTQKQEVIDINKDETASALESKLNVEDSTLTAEETTTFSETVQTQIAGVSETVDLLASAKDNNVKIINVSNIKNNSISFQWSTNCPWPTNIPWIVNIQKPSVTPTTALQATVTPKPTSKPSPTTAPKATVTPKPTSKPSPTTAPKATVTPKPTTVPVTPTSAPSTSSTSLNVRGKTITMGESKSSIVEKFGSPSRVDVTEYNYEFHVYQGNYKNFMMIGIANNKVVAWYTDSTDFSYQGLTSSSKVANINSKFGKNTSLNRTISISDSGDQITFFMDTLGDSTIDGVYVQSLAASKGSTSAAVLSAWEKEILDLTNSFRARNGLSSVTWSAEAAKSAKLHSEDMAKNNYFSHTGLNGSSPFDRMKQQGVSYRTAGENIIGGYGNAMYSNNGWVNSSGHRSNMLNSGYTYLGVGYALGGSYGNYATQNFFGK